MKTFEAIERPMLAILVIGIFISIGTWFGKELTAIYHIVFSVFAVANFLLQTALVIYRKGKRDGSNEP